MAYNRIKFFEEFFNENDKIKKLNYIKFNDKGIDKDKLPDEFKNIYSAGYIFEKIMAYEIYSIIEESEVMKNITGLYTNVKIGYEDISKPKEQLDELDIVILTKTGKLIIFECKSGDMSGDNAKSTKYTTYRLSGVFGMPILLLPIKFCEIKEKGKFEKSISAYKSAKRAGLKVICLDKLDDEMKNLFNKY